MKILNYIRGGIGNQLFQWAIGRAIEIKYGCDVYLDLRHLSPQYGITKREFELSLFPNIKYSLIDDSIINQIYQKEVIELTESNFNTYSSELDNGKNYTLFDYWQKYSLIENYIDDLISDLSCTDSIKEELLKKYSNISNNSVSIHIRRTDYLTSNGFHPVQPISYYERGLEIIGECENIFVFSDDINWCKENLKFKNMTFIEGNDSVTDLWLMSFCTNNIIANSSFSWWGALLNKNKNKKVVVPNNWFSHNNMSTMHPKDWVVI